MTTNDTARVEVTLRPCPLCGAGEDAIEQGYWCDRARNNPSYVKCGKCGCEVEGKSKDHVIPKWNTRLTDPDFVRVPKVAIIRVLMSSGLNGTSTEMQKVADLIVAAGEG